MRRRGLKTAIAKLESRKRPTQFCWPVIIAQYPSENCGEIVGLKSGDHEFPRLNSESDFAAFSLRVQADAGGTLPFNAPRLLVAVYGEPVPGMAPQAPVASTMAPN